MHWRKVRIVRGWLCWRKWSRSNDASSHFRSFPPCLVSLGHMIYELALRWALLKQILSKDPWRQRSMRPAPIPPPFMPHNIFVLTNMDFGHIFLHARVHRLCQSSEVSIPWYPTWLSFRQDISLWGNMGQLIPHNHRVSDFSLTFFSFWDTQAFQF